MAAGSRSTELTEQLLNTQAQVERTFKKRLVREAAFKRAKLDLLDKELDAKRSAARSSAEGAGGGPSAQARSSPMASPQGGLGRSWSSPGAVGSASVGSASQPVSPHACLADPSKERVLGSAGGWAVSRLGASMPLSWHPVPHPGTVAPTRSTADRHAGRRALTASVSTSALPSPSHGLMGASSMTGSSLPAVAIDTPGADGRANARLRQPVGRSASTGLGGRHSLNKSATLAPSVPPCADREEALEAEMEAVNAECEAMREGGLHTGQSDPQEMIERLGSMMALLGPRYKTLSRKTIWERAERGELSAFQRRLKKERELGMVHVNPLKAVFQRDTGAAFEIITPDPESAARAAWLAARRRARRENQAELEEGTGQPSGGAGDEEAIGSNAFVSLPLQS
eukprot:TRINITY_DN74848_c0_g1_i1.p1 TRINITY_DN74848_c0_g1~~TRINITY_DN74848_c0_g1_i1.p1  ORF type:complete len:428 (+),score=75.53 TRINITY_DN74848_c0_g1_i1:89-1285(+)